MSSFFPQSTFFGIDMMGNALNMFSVAENQTSDNISNVNTPGASRQQVDFTEQTPLVGSPFMATHVPGTAGQGVTISQIERIHSDTYDAMFRGASSSQNFYQTQQQMLQGVQSQLGDPNAGVGTQYAAFQTAISQLVSQAGSGNPGASRANVLNAAQTLASALNNSSSAISNAEAQVMQQGDQLVTKVNGILDQIAALNGQIRASTAVGDNPNTFKDQRDYLIDQLSQYLSTNTSIQADGSTLVTVNGQALVNDTVTYHLNNPIIGQATNGTPTFQINFANPAPTSTTPGIPLGSGQLGALQDLYNNKLAAYGTQLDQFAGALSNEVNRITQAGFDQNGQPGTALFQPLVAGQPITAGNIQCAITDPTQLPVSLANTSAGNLVVPLNSSNNTVDTSQQLTNNGNLANPPAAPLIGTLTVSVDGVTSTFNYNTTAGQNSDTINDFVSNFNAAHTGVTASFDPNSQRIVFARDPQNEDLVLRGKQQGNAETPQFTITDSNFVAGTPAVSLVGVLGASNINGVVQGANNAFAASDNGGANALVKMFQANVGIPALETISTTAAVAGTAMTVALPSGVTNVQVGQVLTIDAQPGGAAPQENVTVTGITINPATGIESVTFTPAQNHAANFSVTSAQVQTLQQFYGQTITQVGIDTQTAITGNQTQTSLANNINQTRQSISGINLDEETQNLIKYQNAYAAAAKTIAALNQMLNTVITGLGVG